MLRTIKIALKTSVIFTLNFRNHGLRNLTVFYALETWNHPRITISKNGNHSFWAEIHKLFAFLRMRTQLFSIASVVAIQNYYVEENFRKFSEHKFGQQLCRCRTIKNHILNKSFPNFMSELPSTFLEERRIRV